MAELSSLNAWNFRLIESDRKFYKDLNEIRAMRNMEPIVPSYDWMKSNSEPVDDRYVDPITVRSLTPKNAGEQDCSLESNKKTGEPKAPSFQFDRTLAERMEECAKKAKMILQEMQQNIASWKSTQQLEEEMGQSTGTVQEMATKSETPLQKMQRLNGFPQQLDDQPVTMEVVQKTESGIEGLEKITKPTQKDREQDVDQSTVQEIAMKRGRDLIPADSRINSFFVTTDDREDGTKIGDSLGSPPKKLPRGNDQFPKIGGEFYFSDDGSLEFAPAVMGEWIYKSIDHIEIEMTDYRANSVCPLGNCSAYQAFDEMLDRKFSCGNLIFDPGIVDMSLSMRSSSVLVLFSKRDQKTIRKACYSYNVFVELHYPCSVKWARDFVLVFKLDGGIVTFDPGGICLHQIGWTIMDDNRHLSHYLLLEGGCEGLLLIRSIWVIAWSLLAQRLAFDPGGLPILLLVFYAGFGGQRNWGTYSGIARVWPSLISLPETYGVLFLIRFVMLMLIDENLQVNGSTTHEAT